MDKKIKTNGHAVTLDQKIAACIVASDIVEKSELVKLVEEAEAAIIEAEAVIETETAAALDISNSDPDASDAAVRKAERAVARLEKAIPQLNTRIAEIDAREDLQAWHANADLIEAERDALADELAEVYPTIVEKLADLYERIDGNTEAIGRLHASAPSTAWGETPRRLLDAELIARDLPSYDAAHPPLRNNLRLPDFDISRDTAFPVIVDWNARAALMSAAQAKQLAERFAVSHSADWAKARELQIAEEQAEHAKREGELKQAELESRAAYEKHQKEAELRRRGIMNGA